MAWSESRPGGSGEGTGINEPCQHARLIFQFYPGDDPYFMHHRDLPRRRPRYQLPSFCATARELEGAQDCSVPTRPRVPVQSRASRDSRAMDVTKRLHFQQGRDSAASIRFYPPGPFRLPEGFLDTPKAPYVRGCSSTPQTEGPGTHLTRPKLAQRPASRVQQLLASAPTKPRRRSCADEAAPSCAGAPRIAQ